MRNKLTEADLAAVEALANGHQVEGYKVTRGPNLVTSPLRFAGDSIDAVFEGPGGKKFMARIGITVQAPFYDMEAIQAAIDRGVFEEDPAADEDHTPSRWGYELLYKTDVMRVGWEMDNTLWVLSAPGGEIITATTDHGQLEVNGESLRSLVKQHADALGGLLQAAYYASGSGPGCEFPGDEMAAMKAVTSALAGLEKARQGSLDDLLRSGDAGDPAEAGM